MSNKLTIRIDASAVKESSCFLRFYLNVIKGYRPPVHNNDLVFGTAVHEYIKVMKLTGGNYGEAVQAALKSYSIDKIIKHNKRYMTETYLLKVCNEFWETWQAKDDFVTLIDPATGLPMVEAKFSVPFYSNDEFEVLLEGTIDDLCKHKRGTYALRDYKTTSVGDAVTYMRGYYLSPQLLFYRLILKYYADMYPDSIFADIAKRDVACFIDGIFLRGATQPVEFIRSDVFNFKQTQIDEFEQMLRETAERIGLYALRKQWPRREGMIVGACTTNYGLCKYFDVCAAPDFVSAQHILKRNFIQVPYSPLKFNE